MSIIKFAAVTAAAFIGLVPGTGLPNAVSDDLPFPPPDTQNIETDEALPEPPEEAPTDEEIVDSTPPPAEETAAPDEEVQAPQPVADPIPAADPVCMGDFALISDTSTNATFAGEALTLTAGNHQVSMCNPGATTTDRIVADTTSGDITLTLDNVTIDYSGQSSVPASPLTATGSGIVNLQLAGTNTLNATDTSGWGDYAAVKVGTDTTLNIDNANPDNPGTLNATSNWGAAIGTDYNDGNGGTITINGGTTTATSILGAGIGTGHTDYGTNTIDAITINGGTTTTTSSSGAGIGTGHTSVGGTNTVNTITINGGTVNTASYGGAGIGTGNTDGIGTNTVNTITINSGTTTATSSDGAGIGTGYSPGGTSTVGMVTIVGASLADPATVSATGGGGRQAIDATTVAVGDVGVWTQKWATNDASDTPTYLNGQKGRSDFTEAALTIKTPITYTGDFEVTSDTPENAVDGVTYTDQGVLTLAPPFGHPGYTITLKDGITTTTDRIVADTTSGDVTLTLNAVVIDYFRQPSTPGSPLTATGPGIVKLQLAGTNTLDADNTGGMSTFSAVKVDTGTTLNIDNANPDNPGTLKATSSNGAGIGTDRNGGAGGTITINGGIVNATSFIGAGIGTGTTDSGTNTVNTITINGGTITATSIYGAGIGAGETGGGTNTVNTITINGGTVNTASYGGAGIGTGYTGSGGTSTVNTITISDGTITATSTRGAGIGSGYTNGGTNTANAITINGGTTTATSDIGAGIGTGHTTGGGINTVGTVTITGASLTEPTVVSASGDTVGIDGIVGRPAIMWPGGAMLRAPAAPRSLMAAGMRRSTAVPVCGCRSLLKLSPSSMTLMGAPYPGVNLDWFWSAMT